MNFVASTFYMIISKLLKWFFKQFLQEENNLICIVTFVANSAIISIACKINIF